MTNRLTRSSSKGSNNLTNSKPSTNIRKLRSRKPKIISNDDSEDEYFEVSSERLPQTPKKTDMYLNDDAVTPPKQKKKDVTQIAQHCSDDLINHHTPSRLLYKLSLSSPVQNKISQNRKSLFQESPDDILNSKHDKNEMDETKTKEEYKVNEVDNNEDLIIHNLEENKAQLGNATNNSYRNARKALHAGVPNNLIGREKQLYELRNFIKEHIENCSSGSMYVSGPPGTGKTASLSIILQEKEVSILYFFAFCYNYRNQSWCFKRKNCGCI